MKIQNLNEQPIEKLNYKTVEPGGKVINSELPILAGEITDLPENLDGILVASDLQGIVVRGNNEILLGEILAEILPIIIEIELGIKAEKTGVVLCGDLFASLDKRGGLGDVRKVWDTFRNSFKWVAGIAGNHDSFGNKVRFEEFKKTEGIYYFDKEFKEIEGVKIAGISGIIGKPGRVNRRSEEDYLEILKNLLKKNPDILLLHQTPNNYVEGLGGDENITKIIENSNQTLVFCGHYHWNRPILEFSNKTQVLNVDSRVVILKNTLQKSKGDT